MRFELTKEFLERIRQAITSEDDQWIKPVSYTHLDVYKRQVEAWDIIRRELTLYVIPLTIVAIPLTTFKHYKWVALSFLGAVFLTSFINAGTYFHWWGNKVYDDIRSLSLFVSHLRYA